MRNRILAFGLGLALAAASASAALAATGGGIDDLGLDGIRVNDAAVSPANGSATLTGSISCSKDVDAFVYVQLSQVVGRFNTIRGWGQTDGPVSCSAAIGSASFELSVSPDAGKFAGGNAVVEAGAEAVVCDDFSCLVDDVHYGPASLRLKGGKG